MALKRNETYPGRFNNPTSDHPQGAFKNRSAPGAQDGSFCEQQWANDWDGFFGRLLTVAGITPDGNVDTALSSQYYDALLKVIENNAGSPSIGIPFYWPSSTMPNLVIPEWSGMAFLKFNGSTFSSISYPKLALAFPSLTLPDARGEFIRNWDDGRGIDAGRALLSAQGDAMRRIVGSITNVQFRSATSANTGSLVVDPTTGLTGNASAGGDPARTIRIDTALQNDLPIAAENRPRNIAFNFLVRAA